MSKLLSEEQIKAIFFKQFDMRHLKGRTWGPSDMALREGFKVAFTLLMPIIEEKQKALEKISTECDCRNEEEWNQCSQVAMRALQETKQMLEKQLEEMK